MSDGDPAGRRDDGFADVLNAFSFDSRKNRRTPRPDEGTEPDEEPVVPLAQSRELGTALAPKELDERPATVRAYTWTRGRTTSAYHLEIESLVSTSDRYRSGDPNVPQEYHVVAGMCHQPRSVAEVAALLALPLGVVKVLLGDMVEQTLLVTHLTASNGGQAPEIALMERILAGLHRL